MIGLGAETIWAVERFEVVEIGDLTAHKVSELSHLDSIIKNEKTYGVNFVGVHGVTHAMA
jgi:hypothetical protein